MKLLKAVVAMTLSLSLASAAFADEAYDVVKKFTELSRPISKCIIIFGNTVIPRNGTSGKSTVSIIFVISCTSSY